MRTVFTQTGLADWIRQNCSYPVSILYTIYLHTVYTYSGIILPIGLTGITGAFASHFTYYQEFIIQEFIISLLLL